VFFQINQIFIFRLQVERQAINFVIQSSACDVMKLAMDRINQALDRAFPYDIRGIRE